MKRFEAFKNTGPLPGGFRFLSRLVAPKQASKAYLVLFPLVVAILVVAPFIGFDAVGQDDLIVIALLALVVSGLNLCFGYAGELALGQVAIYAAGAYLGGYLSIHLSSDILVLLVAGVLVGPVVGLITGIPGLRLGGWSFAMVSFFLVLVIPGVVGILGRWTGGDIGLIGVKQATLFGAVLTNREFYVAVVVVAAAWFAALRNIVLSRYGRWLLVMRESPALASAIGIPVFRTKLIAYMCSAIPAGASGVLFVCYYLYITPGSFDFTLAVAILAACVLGGKTSVYGAIFGAALLQLGPLQPGSAGNYTEIIYGLFLIGGGILLPSGVAGVLKLIRNRILAAAVPSDGEGHPVALEAMTLKGEPLEVQGIRKTFGGVVALEDVSLRAEPGRVTSIIGPNGSGKTTLLNLINGFYRPDHGAISLGGRDLHSLRTHDVARAGVARTFQTPVVVRDLSALELVAAGRLRVDRTGLVGSLLRTPRYRRAVRDDNENAQRALDRVGLSIMTDRPSSSLPLGSRRLLELARVIVAEPAVILLDEVASGVDDEAVAELSHVIRALAESGATVILVEHNFSLVLDVSDEIYVLANGSVLASGTAAEISAHPDVIEQYLGAATSREMR